MLQKIRFVFFFFDKKDPKLSLSELLSMMTRIQFNPTLFIWPMWTGLEHAHCLETINTCGSWAKEKVSTYKRKWTSTDSERKRNRSAVSSKWNKCRIYVGDQLDVGTNWRKCYASKLRLKWQRFCLIGKPRHVAFFSQSFFIFYEFMMMPMIIFGRYYSIYVILHLATANYCQWVA